MFGSLTHVFAVFIRKRGRGEPTAMVVDAFLIAELATHDYPANNARAIDLLDIQIQMPVIE